MNCKNCGGTNDPGAKICRFCGSELEEKEKVYIPVHDSYTAPAATSSSNFEDTKVLLMAIISMFMGIVVLRTILAIMSLSKSNDIIKQAREQNTPVPSSVRAAQILSIFSLIFAGFCAVYILISVIVQLTDSYSSITNLYY